MKETVVDAGFTNIRSMIAREMAERTVPGMIVGVARGGEILWQEGFGCADREARIPATAHTAFSVASTTKPFTATAVMILHERGLLDIDRPVNDYLGPAKLRARVGDLAQVTVRRIISHTSGLPNYVQFFYEDKPYTCPTMAQTIQRYGEVMTEPCVRHLYTNLGYGVLTYLIARVSGIAYRDFIRREILLPLGMTRSAIGGEPSLAGYQAQRYGKDGLPIPYYTFDHLGGSALYASAHDLLRFGMCHLMTPLGDQGTILSDAAILEMQRPRVAIAASANARRDVSYGMGWFIRTTGSGCHIVEHAGGMPGVGSDFILLPEEDLVIATVVNGDSKGLKSEVTQAILALLAPACADVPSLVDALRQPQEGEPLTPLLGEWAGEVSTFARQVPMTLRVKACGDVIATVGERLASLVNDVVFHDGRLTGKMLGTLDTEDTRRGPHRLGLDLALSDGTLSGALLAESYDPTDRDYYTLPHWTELSRV
jgi:CubicO group peptidase (beta-lactamase class C family)